MEVTQGAGKSRAINTNKISAPYTQNVLQVRPASWGCQRPPVFTERRWRFHALSQPSANPHRPSSILAVEMLSDSPQEGARGSKTKKQHAPHTRAAPCLPPVSSARPHATISPPHLLAHKATPPSPTTTAAPPSLRQPYTLTAWVC